MDSTALDALDLDAFDSLVALADQLEGDQRLDVAAAAGDMARALRRFLDATLDAMMGGGMDSGVIQSS